MYVCNKCSVELVVDENWAPGNAKAKCYKCKACHCKNGEQWYKNNKDKKRSLMKKRRESEGLGVYLIKYRWINFYVGEGQFNQRKDQHLKYKFDKSNNSEVAKLCTERDLPRKYLSFHVLEYLNDKPTMLERETHYRRVLKPYINPLD